MGKLICVTNRKLCKGDFLEQIRRIAAAKPTAVLLREKDLSETAYGVLARKCYSICKEFGVPLICNTYFSVAERLHTPIQLPFQMCALGKSLTVPFGVSVHSVEEAISAEQQGAVFLIAGHIFETDCKRGLPPRGLGFLESVCRSVSIPVLGIGGITAERMPVLAAVGASGGCVMSGCMAWQNPEQEIRAFRENQII